MAQNPLFSNIQACVFDAYGTLFDVHSAVGQYRERLGDVANQVSTLWRTKQLEYTWLRSLMKQHTDFWEVTRDALVYACDTFGIGDQNLQNALMEAYLHLENYPEVPETLTRLKHHGLPIAILSNGSPAMLEAAITSSGLNHLIDHIFSVEEVGIYKPDPRVYQLAVDRLGRAANAILFQSANAWDAAGAANAGLRVVWINRFGQRRERLPTGPDAELSSLADLPALLGI
jgi:2-haloacid dehalogenase